MMPNLEDRQAITELLSRYGLLIDQQRTDEWMELFLEDAVIEVPGRPPFRTGRGAVGAWLRELLAACTWPRHP